MAGTFNKSLLRVILLHRIINRKKSSRTIWVHPLNLIRPTEGEHNKVDRMHANYPDKFFQYTRMSPALFDKLLAIISPRIAKRNTNFRDAIPVRVRLYITLRYLATGDHIRTIATSFIVGVSTVWVILQQSLSAIWKTLASKYVRWPTVISWASILDGFNSLWNFPNCLGAIDGKHVTIQCPPNTGSLYLNYKGTYSIILMAVCDHDYRFTFVDVGGYGKQSDGGVLANSKLGQHFEAGTIQLPPNQLLPNSRSTLPCCFVADEAFPLTPYMMRPYAKKGLTTKRRIFNYRLSRARRTIENTFGIMAARFRVFRRVLPSQPPTAAKIVLAAVALHNFLKLEEEQMIPEQRYYCPPGYGDSGEEPNGSWRQEAYENVLFEVQKLSVAAQERQSKKVRDQFSDYFSAEGKVIWQNTVVGD